MFHLKSLPDLFKILSLFLLLCCLSGCSESRSTSYSLPEAVENPNSQNCVPAKDLEQSNHLSGIVGGQVLNTNSFWSNKVVMILSEEGLCTGTPIANNIILTAAHCINTQSVDKIYVSLGLNITCESGFDFVKQSIPVKKYILHPKYRPSIKAEYDLALIQLKSALPEYYQISKILKHNQTKSEQTEEILSIVGYGAESSQITGSGYLRQKDVQLQDIKLYSTNPMQLQLEQPKGGICPGDSGGPLFAQLSETQEWVIAGVASAVGYNKIKYNTCEGIGFYIYAPMFQTWIQSEIEKLNLNQ